MQCEVHIKQRTLARLAAHSANAGEVADATVATWRDIDAALSPIVGKRAVAALYARSLHLTRASHPSLADVQDGVLSFDEFASLHAALARQTAPDAAAASAALLQTFTDLLTRLIGAPLTERLLRPVWHNPSSGDAAQDTPT
jgi:hypothetical protein